MSHVRERSFLPMESEEETFFFIIMSNRTFRSLYFGQKSGFKMRFFVSKNTASCKMVGTLRVNKCTEKTKNV